MLKVWGQRKKMLATSQQTHLLEPRELYIGGKHSEEGSGRKWTLKKVTSAPLSLRVWIRISSPTEPMLLPLDHSGSAQVRLFFLLLALLLIAVLPCNNIAEVRNHGGWVRKGRGESGGKTGKLTMFPWHSSLSTYSKPELTRGVKSFNLNSFGVLHGMRMIRKVRGTCLRCSFGFGKN